MKDSVSKIVVITTSRVQAVIEMEQTTPRTIMVTEIVVVTTTIQEVTPKKMIKFKTKKTIMEMTLIQCLTRK